MSRHQSANARVYRSESSYVAPPRANTRLLTVDATPRPMRGILLAAAVAVPLWGTIGFAAHALWTLVR